MFMLFKFLVLFSVFSESGSGYAILLLVRGLQYPYFTVNAGICNIVYICVYIYIYHIVLHFCTVSAVQPR